MFIVYLVNFLFIFYLLFVIATFKYLYYGDKNNEEKFKTLEKEEPDAMEVAAQKNEKREEKT